LADVQYWLETVLRVRDDLSAGSARDLQDSWSAIRELIAEAQNCHADGCHFLLDLHENGLESVTYAAMAENTFGRILAELVRKAAKFLVDQLEYELKDEVDGRPAVEKVKAKRNNTRTGDTPSLEELEEIAEEFCALIGRLRGQGKENDPDTTDDLNNLRDARRLFVESFVSDREGEAELRRRVRLLDEHTAAGSLYDQAKESASPALRRLAQEEPEEPKVLMAVQRLVPGLSEPVLSTSRLTYQRRALESLCRAQDVRPDDKALFETLHDVIWEIEKEAKKVALDGCWHLVTEREFDAFVRSSFWRYGFLEEVERAVRSLMKWRAAQSQVLRRSEESVAKAIIESARTLMSTTSSRSEETSEDKSVASPLNVAGKAPASSMRNARGEPSENSMWRPRQTRRRHGQQAGAVGIKPPSTEKSRTSRRSISTSLRVFGDESRTTTRKRYRRPKSSLAAMPSARI
jgi:hypothetical protein